MTSPPNPRQIVRPRPPSARSHPAACPPPLRADPRVRQDAGGGAVSSGSRHRIERRWRAAILGDGHFHTSRCSATTTERRTGTVSAPAGGKNSTPVRESPLRWSGAPTRSVLASLAVLTCRHRVHVDHEPRSDVNSPPGGAADRDRDADRRGLAHPRLLVHPQPERGSLLAPCTPRCIFSAAEISQLSTGSRQGLCSACSRRWGW